MTNTRLCVCVQSVQPLFSSEASESSAGEALESPAASSGLGKILDRFACRICSEAVWFKLRYRSGQLLFAASPMHPHRDQGLHFYERRSRGNCPASVAE